MYVSDNDETSNYDDERSTISDHDNDNESVPDNDFDDDAFLTYKNKRRNNNLSSKNSNKNNATARIKTVIHMTVQNKTVKQINHLKLGKFFANFCDSPQIDRRHAITGALRIVCTRTQADKLLSVNKLDFCNDVVTFSENTLISPKSQGLIRVISTDYSNEEMMEAL